MLWMAVKLCTALPLAHHRAVRNARAVALRSAGRTAAPLTEANLFSRVARIFKSYANAAGVWRGRLGAAARGRWVRPPVPAGAAASAAATLLGAGAASCCQNHVAVLCCAVPLQ